MVVEAHSEEVDSHEDDSDVAEEEPSGAEAEGAMHHHITKYFLKWQAY